MVACRRWALPGEGAGRHCCRRPAPVPSRARVRQQSQRKRTVSPDVGKGYSKAPLQKYPLGLPLCSCSKVWG